MALTAFLIFAKIFSTEVEDCKIVAFMSTLSLSEGSSSSVSSSLRSSCPKKIKWFCKLLLCTVRKKCLFVEFLSTQFLSTKRQIQKSFVDEQCSTNWSLTGYVRGLRIRFWFFENFSSKKDFEIFRFFDKNSIEKNKKKAFFSLQRSALQVWLLRECSALLVGC